MMERVDAAVLARGRGQGEEGDVRLPDSVVVRRGAKAVARVLVEQFVETRFVDRRLAGVDRRDDVLVDVDVDDVMTQIGEVGPRASCRRSRSRRC